MPPEFQTPVSIHYGSGEMYYRHREVVYPDQSSPHRTVEYWVRDWGGACVIFEYFYSCSTERTLFVCFGDVGTGRRGLSTFRRCPLGWKYLVILSPPPLLEERLSLLLINSSLRLARISPDLIVLNSSLTHTSPN